MKLKKMKLTNFANFTNFECEFDGNITRLVGMNGAGKTTIGLTAIWACLKGIAERSNDALIGERFRFIGKSKASADIELTLFDEKKKTEIKIRNHITKQSNDIRFDAPDNYEINSDWMNNLLSVAFLSAKNFTQLSSKEQALTLGINLDEIDKEINSLKEEFTLLNRDLKNIGEVKEIEKTEKVFLSDLLKEQAEITKFNNLQQARAENLLELEKKILDYKDQIKNLQAAITLFEEKSKTIPKPEPIKNETEIINKIKSAEEINLKAAQYDAYLEKKKKFDILNEKINKNKSNQEALKEKRLNKIKEFKFGFDGLEVDEAGGLILKERPIKEPYFSKGELELIVARLYKAKNPELKLRFIDDFELLDESNQEKIIKELIDDGFQIITAEVGEKTTKNNTIILRECKVIEDSSKNNLV